MAKNQEKDQDNDPRARMLEMAEQLAEHARNLRNYGAKPGNVWLARSELGKIYSLSTELEELLDEIKRADERH